LDTCEAYVKVFVDYFREDETMVGMLSNVLAMILVGVCGTFVSIKLLRNKPIGKFWAVLLLVGSILTLLTLILLITGIFIASSIA
jgi:hypothetical protein